MNEKDQTILLLKDTLNMYKENELTEDESLEALKRIIDNWTLTLHIMHRRGINTLTMTLSS